jgi:ABC-2 type transport system permease protein
MIEAMAGVASGESLSEVADHTQFLTLFALAMVGAGWLAYRRMVRVERQL